MLPLQMVVATAPSKFDNPSSSKLATIKTWSFGPLEIYSSS